MVRNLLIIANPCPPAASTGASMRLRKWCEYLPDFGWQPTVVTGPLANSTRCAPLEGVSVLAIPDRDDSAKPLDVCDYAIVALPRSRRAALVA
jgi:hypothetical protein